MAAYISASGMLTCDCDIWRDYTKVLDRDGYTVPRYCHHTDELRRVERLKVTRLGDYYFVFRPHGKRGCEKLLWEFEDMVRALASIPARQRYAATPHIREMEFMVQAALSHEACQGQHEALLQAHVRLTDLLLEARPDEVD